MEKAPLVSIILPVFNCEKYILSSVNSILTQTYKNIELIIVNDGSTDSTRVELDKIKDSRVKIFHQENIGLANTLNVLISKCEGDFIARQDADDISLPERIEKQLEYFERHPKCGLVGAWAKIIDENDIEKGTTLTHPYSNKEMRYFLYFDNPLVHTSVMFRRQTLLQLDTFYRYERELQPEDYELWTRISMITQLGNVPEYLVRYRELPTSISRLNKDPFPFLNNLSAIHISRSSNFLIPYSIAKKFIDIFRNKVKVNIYTRFFIVSYVGLILLVKERSYSRFYMGRIKQMLIDK